MNDDQVEEVVPNLIHIESVFGDYSIGVGYAEAVHIYKLLEHYVKVGVRCECGFGTVGIHGEAMRCPCCKKEITPNKDYDDRFIKFEPNGEKYCACRIRDCKTRFEYRENEITSLCPNHRKFRKY